MSLSEQPRRNFPVPLAIAIRLPDGSQRNEYAVNVSSSGLCVHAADPLPADGRFWVTFRLPPAGPEVRATARVVWTSWQATASQGGRFWETGLQLDGLAPETEAVLEAYARQPQDRRR